MIVVSDASPICYLVWIGEIELLPKLFIKVHLPKQVLDELNAEGAPQVVRRWADAPPSWVSVHDVPPSQERDLEHLHAGERAAILLAEKFGAAMILLDEKAARRLAAARGLRVAGLLGLLVEAANRGLIDLPAAIEKLTKTSFRYSPALIKTALERYHL